jgi:hypothetical protein
VRGGGGGGGVDGVRLFVHWAGLSVRGYDFCVMKSTYRSWYFTYSYFVPGRPDRFNHVTSLRTIDTTLSVVSLSFPLSAH